MAKVKQWLGTIVCSLALSAQASVAWAESRMDLYAAKVEIADRSQATRARVLSQALAQVLVKVTGSPVYLEHPVLVEALQDSNRYLQAYSYSTLPPTTTYLHARFGAAPINQLLNQADAPMWPANRPDVLVWLVQKDYKSGIRLVLPDQLSDMQQSLPMLSQLQEAAVAVGLPILLPSREFPMAADDAAASAEIPADDPLQATMLPQAQPTELGSGISADSIWALDMSAIASASEGYGADGTLVGRIAQTSSGSWRIGWHYQQGDRSEIFDSSELEFGQAVADGLAQVTRHLSSIYAVSSGTGGGEPLATIISGVDDFSDYAQVVNYLDGLAAVSHYDIQAVDGQRLVLMLYVSGGYRSLSTALALDNRLQPVATDTGAASAPAVQLRWLTD